MELGHVDVVLVRPARPANVAAACRALKNMGLSSLVLVAPPPGLADPEARALAYGAWDVLDAAVARATLREAVASSRLVAGTTGRPLPGAWTPRQLATEAFASGAGGRLAVVFGPEASGLTNDELAQCHVRVHIPADPAHPSLNLAQAVLLIAYELRLAAAAGLLRNEEVNVDGEQERASAGEIEDALDDLRGALLGVGYLNPANPEAILSEWRRLVVRARPTRREVALLRGMARQVSWAAERVARGRGEDDNRDPPGRGGV